MIMTNSRVLQFIIAELKNSPIKWKNSQELFEIICHPIPFGQEYEKKCQLVKKPIIKLFKKYKRFNKEKFNFLVNSIHCNENEQLQRAKLLNFLQENLENFYIQSHVNIKDFVKNIPCKDKNITNYRSKFSHWQNKYCEIQDENIKKCLQKNFYFKSELWENCEAYQKENLRKGIKKFITQYLEEPLVDTSELYLSVDEVFGLKDNLTSEEFSDLFKIRDMNQDNIREYIDKNRPLSQLFILKLIPILYHKGYYELLLKEALETLKPYIYNNTTVKKLHARVLGSPTIRRYKEAHEILKNIEVDCQAQLIDIQTEAISNIRRYKLIEYIGSREKKIEILQDLCFYYQKVFQENEIYHYYPGINLAYIVAISKIISDTKYQPVEEIVSIFQKSKKSIIRDKKSRNYKINYYASISYIEFKILQSRESSLVDLSNLLNQESDFIPKIGLEKTQRQMQFFVDILMSFQIYENKTLLLMKNAINIIDNFMNEIDIQF